MLTASAILVGLVDRFGGGLRLIPSGSFTPGTFCALIVTATTRISLLATLAGLRLGRLDSLRALSYSGLTSLSVRSSTRVGTFGDGEWLGLQHRTQVGIERAALRVIAPFPYSLPGESPEGSREVA